jgi:hypothetical protein
LDKSSIEGGNKGGGNKVDGSRFRITDHVNAMQHPIREWFEQHDGDDGDFCIAPRSVPFDVVPPTDATDTVLYCTKPHPIFKLLHDLGDDKRGDWPPLAAILRRGLLSESDANWLAAIAGSRRLFFFGDADPADLLIYAWLHERLTIEYCGLSDVLLQKCGVPFANRLTIEMKSSELAAMPLVAEHVGDLPALLGPWCAGLLTAGRKIELEALFSFSTCGPSQIAEAFTRCD